MVLPFLRGHWTILDPWHLNMPGNRCNARTDQCHNEVRSRKAEGKKCQVYDVIFENYEIIVVEIPMILL